MRAVTARHNTFGIMMQLIGYSLMQSALSFKSHHEHQLTTIRRQLCYIQEIDSKCINIYTNVEINRQNNGIINTIVIVEAGTGSRCPTNP